MKSLIIKAVCYLSYYTGIIHLFYLLNRTQRVITYHNIIPDSLFDNTLHLGFSHTENVFKKHLQIINKRFKVSNQSGLKGSAMLTFDDGYFNNYCIAAKELAANHNLAIFFVPSSMVDSTEPLWIDKVMLWFSYVPQGNYTVLDLKLNITDSISRLKCYETIYASILNGYNLKSTIIDILQEQYSFQKISIDPEFYKLRFTGITSQQIDLLKASGHLISSHSVRHDILSKLDNNALKNDFETTFNNPLYNNTLISYPFGGEEEISPLVIALFMLTGYTHAYTNIQTNTENSFLLSRFTLPNTTNTIEIEAELSGFKQHLRNILRPDYCFLFFKRSLKDIKTNFLSLTTKLLQFQVIAVHGEPDSDFVMINGSNGLGAGRSEGEADSDFVMINSLHEFVSFIDQFSFKFENCHIERFVSGSSFVCLTKNNEIVSCGWIARAKKPFYMAEIKKSVIFDSDLYIYDFSTSEKHGDNAYYPVILKNIIMKFPDKKIGIAIDSTNIPLINSIRMAGFKYIKTLKRF